MKAIRLRAWQQEALTSLEARQRPSFLAVATPGAGKTTFALAAMRRALVARQVRRLVVVVPTQHLKLQWAEVAERQSNERSWSVRITPVIARSSGR